MRKGKLAILRSLVDSYEITAEPGSLKPTKTVGKGPWSAVTQSLDWCFPIGDLFRSTQKHKKK